MPTEGGLKARARRAEKWGTLQPAPERVRPLVGRGLAPLLARSRGHSRRRLCWRCRRPCRFLPLQVVCERGGERFEIELRSSPRSSIEALAYAADIICDAFTGEPGHSGGRRLRQLQAGCWATLAPPHRPLLALHPTAVKLALDAGQQLKGLHLRSVQAPMPRCVGAPARMSSACLHASSNLRPAPSCLWPV